MTAFTNNAIEGVLRSIFPSTGIKMSIDFVDTQRFGGRQERKIDTHTEPQKKESALYMGCILGPAGPRCASFGRICDQSRKEYGGMK